MKTSADCFLEIEGNAAFSRVGVKLVTHPKKTGKCERSIKCH